MQIFWHSIIWNGPSSEFISWKTFAWTSFYIMEAKLVTTSFYVCSNYLHSFGEIDFANWLTDLCWLDFVFAVAFCEQFVSEHNLIWYQVKLYWVINYWLNVFHVQGLFLWAIWIERLGVRLSLFVKCSNYLFLKFEIGHLVFGYLKLWVFIFLFFGRNSKSERVLKCSSMCVFL